MRPLLIAALLPLAACQSQWEKDRGDTGPKAARSFAETGFTRVELGGPDDVIVRQGTFAVRAEGPQKILDQLDIRVEGGALKVGRKPGDNGWHGGDDGVRITVTMPRLIAAHLVGSGDLSADKAEGDFNGDVAGSGDLSIAALTATATTLSLAGSGDIKIAGTTSSLKVSIVGSGDIDATGLAAATADISIAGSGGLKGKVSGDSNVSIAGSGDVILSGGGKCNSRIVGSGEARCK